MARRPPVERPPLLEAVVSKIVHPKPGFPTWFQRLPDDLRKELRELREQWLAGKIVSKQKPLAVAIAQVMEDRGHARPGEQAVLAWLRRGV